MKTYISVSISYNKKSLIWRMKIQFLNLSCFIFTENIWFLNVCWGEHHPGRWHPSIQWLDILTRRKSRTVCIYENFKRCDGNERNKIYSMIAEFFCFSDKLQFYLSFLVSFKIIYWSKNNRLFICFYSSNIIIAINVYLKICWKLLLIINKLYFMHPQISLITLYLSGGGSYAKKKVNWKQGKTIKIKTFKK